MAHPCADTELRSRPTSSFISGNNNPTCSRSCLGGERDQALSAVPGTQTGSAKGHQAVSPGPEHLPSHFKRDSSRQPGRELPGQWGGGGAARQLPAPAAFQEVLQAVVLINTLLFPPWHLSLCLLCTNRAFSDVNVADIQHVQSGGCP